MKPLDFIKIAVKDYKKVGAVTITSQHTIKRVLKVLKPEYKYIVEYGAGNGVITKELLKALPADGKLIAIELNGQLFGELSKIKDPRLKAVHGDVLSESKDFSQLGLPRLDAVISSLPLALLSGKQREQLIENTYQGLVYGGRFIVCQYTLIVLPVLKNKFKKVSYSLEVRNLLPYFVMVGEK